MMTATGRRIGTNAGNAWLVWRIAGSICPVTTIAAAATVSPRNIAPESPMKIRAGKKLCGRKPRQTPTTHAMTIVARLE